MCYEDHCTYQYGVPLNELHLCTAFVPRDDTPKSAVKSNQKHISSYPTMLNGSHKQKSLTTCSTIYDG